MSDYFFLTYKKKGFIQLIELPSSWYIVTLWFKWQSYFLVLVWVPSIRCQICLISCIQLPIHFLTCFDMCVYCVAGNFITNRKINLWWSSLGWTRDGLRTDMDWTCKSKNKNSNLTQIQRLHLFYLLYLYLIRTYKTRIQCKSI